MKIFSLANQKGGVAKTTSAINIGGGLALRGFRVLLIDLDPQGNLTTGLGLLKSPEEQEATMAAIAEAKRTARTDSCHRFTVPS